MKNFKLKRVWVEERLCTDSKIKIILKEKIHHLTTVLKIRSGEKIRLFNEQDGEWLGEVQEKNKKEIIIKILSSLRKAEQRIGRSIAIAFAPIKLDRLRFLIEKSTELGADEFIPVITERGTIRNINSDKLKSYTLSASEQSERISVPKIKKTLSLERFLSIHNEEHILFCNERSNSEFIADALKEIPNKTNIIIFIGPEGGFTEKEKNNLTAKKNISSISLGENILRSETAAIFALSCVTWNIKK